MKNKVIFIASVLVLALAIFSLFKVSFLDSESNGTTIDGTSSSEQTTKKPKPSELSSKMSELYSANDYKSALSLLSSSSNTEPAEEVKKIAVDCLNGLELQLHKELSEHIKKYEYSLASDKIKALSTLVPQNISWQLSEKTQKIEKLCTNYSTLVEYKGAVEHLFFHPLIAYKELAFDGDYQAKGLDNYFTTIPEFKEVIKQLYEKNYVLIDIHLLYTVDAEGKPHKAPIMLPEGKKPVVISIDDLNFYDYMKEHGMAHGFLIQDGKIFTYSDRPDGTRDISDDNSIVPILDKFVEEHPDFSFGGAKGIIASTGYNGTLGFPTDEVDSPDYQENFNKAKEMADLLKSNGWFFASHSYGHGSPSKQSLEKIKRDNDVWIEEVVPIVGETDVYIYPYGELIKPTDPKHQYIVNNGFKMFCGVQSKSAYLKYFENSVLMQRRNIDGIAMKAGNINNLLDISKILDPDRPNYD